MARGRPAPGTRQSAPGRQRPARPNVSAWAAQKDVRMFKLLAQQPIDECLELLGDCIVAGLERHSMEPIFTITRKFFSLVTVRSTQPSHSRP